MFEEELKFSPASKGKALFGTKMRKESIKEIILLLCEKDFVHEISQNLTKGSLTYAEEFI